MYTAECNGRGLLELEAVDVAASCSDNISSIAIARNYNEGTGNSSAADSAAGTSTHTAPANGTIAISYGNNQNNGSNINADNRNDDNDDEGNNGRIPSLLSSSKSNYRTYVNKSVETSTGTVGLFTPEGGSPDDKKVVVAIESVHSLASHIQETLNLKDVLVLVDLSKFLVWSLELQFSLDKRDAQVNRSRGLHENSSRLNPLLKHGLDIQAVHSYLENDRTSIADMVALFRNATTMLVYTVNIVLSKLQLSGNTGVSNPMGYNVFILLNKSLKPTGTGPWPLYNGNGTAGGTTWQMSLVDCLLRDCLQHVAAGPASLLNYERITLQYKRLNREEALNEVYFHLKGYKVLVHDFAKAHNLIVPLLRHRVILMEDTMLVVGFAARFALDRVHTYADFIWYIVCEYMNVKPVWKNSYRVSESDCDSVFYVANR